MDFQDARVMKAVCVILAVVMLIIVGIATRNYNKPKRALLIPTLICLLVMLPSLVMIFLPNGTVGYTQLEYFGVLMYASWTFVFTCVGEIIITIIKKFLLVS